MSTSLETGAAASGPDTQMQRAWIATPGRARAGSSLRPRPWCSASEPADPRP